MVSQRNKKQDVQTSSLMQQLIEHLSVPFAPEGWFTIKDLCQRTGRSRQTIERFLHEKKVECRKFATNRSDGRIVVLIHYKL